MKVIRFSQNWAGKLSNPVYFTTFRMESDYYKIGDAYEIQLTSKGLPKPKLVSIAKIKHIAILEYDKLNDFLCFIDTGYNAKETREIFDRMYKGTDWKTQKLYFILLEVTKRYNTPEVNTK